ncbi:MAG TPA: hypothetical protein VK897_17330 [Anaerolineales bacterium]|nr:hypothetical protein [Anaerolineales bacterium]
MPLNLRIRDTSGWTMFIFGALALLLGLLGLLRPELLLSILGFAVLDRAERAPGDYTLVFMIASSMASFNMGIYYVLAALNNVKSFYKWTVPFRCVTFVVFTTAVIVGLAPGRFLGVGLWELVGALATGIALYAENRKPGTGIENVLIGTPVTASAKSRKAQKRNRK